MKKIFFETILGIIALIVFSLYFHATHHSVKTPHLLTSVNPTQKISPTVTIPAGNMKLASPFFKNSEIIPPQFSCKRDNDNPELDISGVPVQAKSLALVIEDPDAPGGTWYHWLVFNLPPDTKTILEHSEPATVGTGSNGKTEFEGPCPPDNKTHHYIFTLYALDKMIDLPTSTTAPQFRKATQKNILEQTQLTGLFTGPVK